MEEGYEECKNLFILDYDPFIWEKEYTVPKKTSSKRKPMDIDTNESKTNTIPAKRPNSPVKYEETAHATQKPKS